MVCHGITVKDSIMLNLAEIYQCQLFNLGHHSSGTYTDPFRFPIKNLYLKQKYNLNVTEENIFFEKMRKLH